MRISLSGAAWASTRHPVRVGDCGTASGQAGLNRPIAAARSTLTGY
jgi:hypothetical protein